MVKSNSQHGAFLVMFVLLAATIAGMSVDAVGATARRETPILRPTSLRPLTLHGLHFRAGEKVRVTVVYTGKTRSAVRRVSAKGAFTVTFPEVRVDRCSGELVVKASGSLGSRVGFRLNQLQCGNDRADD